MYCKHSTSATANATNKLILSSTLDSTASIAITSDFPASRPRVIHKQFQYPSREMNAVSSDEEAAIKCRTGFDNAFT